MVDFTSAALTVTPLNITPDLYNISPDQRTAAQFKVKAYIDIIYSI